MRFVRQLGRRLLCGLSLALGIVALQALDAQQASLHAAQPGRLSGTTIDELVRGATVHMHTPFGTVVPVKFADDGTLSGKTSGMVAYYLGASKDRGRWWIKGRRLCQQWGKWFSGKPKCIEIRRQGQKFHWKDREGETGVATIASRPKKVIARAKQRAALKRKPIGLGLAAAPITALPEPVETTVTTPRARAANKLAPRRKAVVRRYVTFKSPPPLPTRSVGRSTSRHAGVKLSSWTMRAQ